MNAVFNSSVLLSNNTSAILYKNGGHIIKMEPAGLQRPPAALTFLINLPFLPFSVQLLPQDAPLFIPDVLKFNTLKYSINIHLPKIYIEMQTFTRKSRHSGDL